MTAVHRSPVLLPADPRAAYLARKNALDRAIRRVLESGWYIQGQENAAFEAEFTDYCGARFAIGTGSGTDALQLALRACGIGPGEQVVTVSHTAVATVAAIDLAGATAVLLDVEPRSYTMDPEQLEAVLRQDTDRTIRAVIPVHLYGHPCDMPVVMEIARRYEVYVIEDCAQAHGAVIAGRRCGSWGDFGAFSFYPTKNLGALGDAGGLVTDDARLADRAAMLKQYGWRERYVSHQAGMNTRLDEMQAAVLRVKLPYLDDDNARRREIADHYTQALSGSAVRPPSESDDVYHVYHQYVVECDDRDALRAHLHKAGFGTAILYPVPVHLQPGYRDRVSCGPNGLGRTERLCRRILSLPMHPELTDRQVEEIASLCARWEPGRAG